MIRKTALRHGVAALALGVAMVALTSGPATAVSQLPITCSAAGTVQFQNSGPITNWQVLGKGSCQGDLNGTYFLDFSGVGTSDSLGNCQAMQGGSVVPVTGLDIAVAATLTNAATLVPKLVNMHWYGPIDEGGISITTYPIVTPFLINRGGALQGAGAFFNHIFVQCLNSPVAQFDFGFLS